MAHSEISQNRLESNNPWNSTLVHLLVVLFGLGSWICVVGVFTELPLFVGKLPEGWALPSFFCLIVSSANVGLFLICLGLKYWPRVINQRSSITTLLVIGNLATFLLIFYWDTTVQVFGTQHSLFLFGFTFCLALLDCGSRVLFLPFISQFHPSFIKSYFIGESLTGLLPSIFSLLQGTGTGGSITCVPFNMTMGNSTRILYEEKQRDPRISVSTFFILMFLIMLLCSGSFGLLNVKSIVARACNPIILEIRSSTTPPDKMEHKFPFSKISPLLVIVCVVCMIYASTESILSYSTIPYGSEIFLYAVTLRYSAASLLCCINHGLPNPHHKIMYPIYALLGISAFWSFVTASTSPHPPLQGLWIGSVLIVGSSIITGVCFAYIKVSIAIWIQAIGGCRGFFWFGIAIQIGFGSSAILMFFLVNIWELFKSQSNCP